MFLYASQAQTRTTVLIGPYQGPTKTKILSEQFKSVSSKDDPQTSTKGLPWNWISTYLPIGISTYIITGSRTAWNRIISAVGKTCLFE